MVEEQVLGLEIAMHNVEFVQVLNTSYDLVQELAGLRLFDPLVLHNVVKELSAAGILHDQVQLLWSLDDLKV